MGINKDQVEGRAKVVGGTATAVAGKAIGSEKLLAKGQAEQTVGKAQARYGDIKESIKASLKPKP